MNDRGKVIKALECCVSLTHNAGKCTDCEYAEQFNYAECETYLLRDALVLLKEQEQQATTPEAEWLLFNGRRGATCSYCKHTFDDVYDVENHDYYCRHCGAKMVKIRAVKWE